MAPPDPNTPPQTGAAPAGKHWWRLAWIRPGLLGALVLALVLVLLNGLSPHRSSQLWGLLLGEREGDMAGFLSIEPPQVYTRERLVNDRFREATWLNLQLEETKDPAHRDRFATASTGLISRHALQFEAGRAEATPQPGGESAPVAPPPALTATRLDELSLLQMRALYRARLRNDLMDTLLDDGHDLDGNTLYRLNFDAAAMPWPDRRLSPGSAVFVVRLRGSVPRYYDGAGAADPALLRARIADDLDMFRDWQQKMQVFLSSVLEWRVHDFRKTGTLFNPVDPKEGIAFDRQLRLALVEQFLRLAAQVGYSAECANPVIAAEFPDHCALWAAGPGTGPLEPDTLAARMEWLAAATGFAWSATDPSPETRSATTLSGLIGGLKAAEAVTEIRVQTSPLALQYEVQKAKALSQGQPPPPPEAVFPPDQVRQLLSEYSRLRDPEMKRAMFLVLAALRAMEGQIPALAAQGFRGQDIGHPDAWGPLNGFLMAFAGLPPDAIALRAYETDLRRRGYGEIGEALPGEAGPPPKPLLRTQPHDLCSQEMAAAVGAPPYSDPEALFAYGRCMFLHVEERLLVEEIFARFLQGRLSGSLKTHDENDTPITLFLAPKLASCGLTGCRIEMDQHRLFGPALYGMGLQGADAQSLFNEALEPPKGIGSTSLEAGWWVRLSEAEQIERLLGLAQARAGSEAGGQMADMVVACLKQARDGLKWDMGARGVEIYLACALRDWLENDRSPLTIYGVSPRLAGPVVEAAQNARTGLGLGGLFGWGKAGGSSQAEEGRRSTQVEPRVLGFGDLPLAARDHDPEAQDIAFGWAIRPQRSASGRRWSPEHHRLSAVVSVPSWWNSLEIEVRACWMTTQEARKLAQTLLKTPAEICTAPVSAAAPVPGQGAPEPAAAARTAPRQFTVQLPRRVDDIVERFNFDFIKAPYYDRDWVAQMNSDPAGLTLEVGRPGHLVLEGERLWRGTVVTLNNQIADAIVVLPDMRGVIAEFHCVLPPPRMGAQTQVTRQAKVWTSEGSINVPDVRFTPFVRRRPDDTPCDPAARGREPVSHDSWSTFTDQQAQAAEVTALKDALMRAQAELAAMEQKQTPPTKAPPGSPAPGGEGGLSPAPDRN